ncbi:DUF6911 family protein [Photorhabdus hindustanensis]|uniref:Uncharacterized protein n=1 Tax=Photorhabdus hindustanensis TaxID=2918802 RepID=A0A2S8PUJ2_9GAMM|nr:hypothetical protein [Photorhabdus hindustanensis]PQQ22498.1 hypothetical protein C6H66_23300 [Photorhabdus hindustanensis]
MNDFIIGLLFYGKKGYKTISNPIWGDVESFLDNIKYNSGEVSLELREEPNFGPVNIRVSASDGNYLITLLEYTEDDSEVRTYWDETKPDKQILLYANYWPARQLTTNFDFVVKVFKEFFDTGNVSKELLN